MCEHERSWSGPYDTPIVAARVKVDRPEEAEINGEFHNINGIPKDEFEAEKKVVNGNTARKTVGRHSHQILKNLTQRSCHLEVR